MNDVFLKFFSLSLKFGVKVGLKFYHLNQLESENFYARNGTEVPLSFHQADINTLHRILAD
jgi:hypothetical protein